MTSNVCYLGDKSAQFATTM